MRLLPPRWKLTLLAATAAPLLFFAPPAPAGEPEAPPATAPLPAPPPVAATATAPLPASPPATATAPLPASPPATATAPLPAPPPATATAPFPVGVAAGAGPQAARGPQDWQPGLPPPPGFRLVEKRRWPFVTGLAVFGSSWGFSLLLGGIALGVGTNKPAAGVFLIPVLGPFIDLAWQKMTTDDAVFTGIVGGLQALGAASLIAGIVLPKRQKLVPLVGDVRLSPVITPQAQGFGLTGSF